MEIMVPDEEPILVSARVASHTPAGDGSERHHLGIEFLEMPQQARSRLEGLIDQAATEG